MPGEPASDQFSLAVTLYVLACGKLPFGGHALPQLVFDMVHRPHTDIRVHDPALPPALVVVLDRALQKRPEKRYRSAGELGRALRAVAARDRAPRTAAA
jgi:serine/threonine protein kinase